LLPGLAIAASLACSSSSPGPTGPPDPFETLAVVEANYDSASPVEVARHGDRLYFSTGPHCMNGLYAVGASPSSTATILEQACTSSLAIDDQALYVVMGADVVACPLDGPCASSRKVASMPNVPVLGPVLAAGKLAMFIPADLSGAASLVTLDIATGTRSPELAHFDAEEVPARLVSYGDEVFYVRHARGGSAAKDENALEKLSPAATAPAVLASQLAFVSDLAVDEQGVVFIEGGSSEPGKPPAKVRSLPRSGGAPTTLTTLQLADRVALAPSTFVLIDRTGGEPALVRFRRSDGAPLGRSLFAVTPTTNVLATEQDVTFGFSTTIPQDAGPYRGRGTIAREPFPPSGP
jgi:hypothetical protein